MLADRLFAPAGGDSAGRRPVLIGVVALMTGATTLIGALSAYATSGALAPWPLFFLREFQGFPQGVSSMVRWRC
ncbi:hypothetical protein M878_06840 [Streptomyces roseochromogenus subsp. oscitans DS 12.976]|uniref:Major facilitator superfamily (MFS) profile domain-containing protein n=1 Tax=Streptomyces roseochromogenus subsp. oscitans DS 12.976 TaxID=1352936 RepID=V6KT09_STRRC|nr:hypothetical protein M878_06840 [Streptomyces roseochromogenus subsp. oscitans DS 12.976]